MKKLLFTLIFCLCAVIAQAATQTVLEVKTTGKIVAICDATTCASIQALQDVPTDYQVATYTVYNNMTTYNADQSPKLKGTACAKLTKPEKAAFGCP